MRPGSYYFHVYGEGDEQDEEDTQTSSYSLLIPDLPARTLTVQVQSS